MVGFEQRLKSCAADVEDLLGQLLAPPAIGDVPERLASAMRHAVLGGGKRFRPFLLVESAALCSASPPADAMRAAAALECLHCYSLVHDDLPAMDNDALRRGQPTVWKAFDEWTAILAGDALLTLAFEILAEPATHADPLVRARLSLGLPAPRACRHGRRPDDRSGGRQARATRAARRSPISKDCRPRRRAR